MAQEEKDNGKVLFVGRDIFLGTMVSQALQKGGFRNQAVSPLQVRSVLAGTEQIRAIVVDLKETRDHLSEIVDAVGTKRKIMLVGIAFHTDHDAKNQAHKAGIDHVMHRSQIQSQLSQLLLTGKAV